MTDARVREAAPAPIDPGTLRWLSPAFVAAEPSSEAGALGHAFRIRERWFLIPADLPAEVSPRLFCARLPFTQPWCLGLANFRGELVPVYDLGALLADSGPQSGRYLLILGRRDARAALSIDEITVVTVPAEAETEVTSPLPNLPGELICRGLSVEGRTYAELDLGGLMSLLARLAGVL